jgi:hypothetical protein
MIFLARENGLIKKVGSSMGGLKLGKKAGDGPKWWNHENDSSAARRGTAHWCGGRVIRCELGFFLAHLQFGISEIMLLMRRLSVLKSRVTPDPTP